MEDSIREYNFAVSGNIDRHIPGIPGLWPMGSRVQVNEDTNQVVSVWPEGATPLVPSPVEKATEQAAIQTPTIPPALPDEQPENRMQ